MILQKRATVAGETERVNPLFGRMANRFVAGPALCWRGPELRGAVGLTQLRRRIKNGTKNKLEVE
jgi:hypothetical protein